MSENNHKEWVPGLVALYRADLGSGVLDLVLRAETNVREYISHRGEWRADLPDVCWEAVTDIWGEAVWIGTRAAFQRMRGRAKTPVDLLRIARDSAAAPETTPSVVIFGEEYVKASDSREALGQAETTIETLRRDLGYAEGDARTWCDRFDYECEQMDRIRAALGERFSGASAAEMVAEIDRLRERMDDIPGLLAGVLGFRPYEITAEGLGGSPSSLPKGRGLVAYTVETKYPDGRAVTKATLACQE